MTDTNPATVPTISKTYKYFDLDSMSKKSETVEVPFTAPATYAEAVARVGNDESKLLKAVTAELRADALATAAESVKAKGASSAIVMKFVGPWRMAPPYDGIEDRGKQTSAILEFFKANPAFITAIKAASAKAEAEGVSEENDSEDSE